MTVLRQPLSVGRFAPTPSGPLHAGSLATALGSWLAARRAGGRWLLRFDDLDGPRNQPGAIPRITDQLARHGLAPDAIVLSSALAGAHADAFAALRRQGGVYPCNCTRARLRVHARPGPWGPIYDGHCWRHPPTGDGPVAWRWHLDPGVTVVFDDAGQGPQAAPGAAIGDPVLRRADGVTGYALACAVDEHALRVTEVVRGADLLGATFPQVALLQTLGHPVPRYTHLPLVVGPDGRKLSKQNGATPLADGLETAQLRVAARHLGLTPPDPAAAPGPAGLLAALLAPARTGALPWAAPARH